MDQQQRLEQMRRQELANLRMIAVVAANGGLERFAQLTLAEGQQGDAAEAAMQQAEAKKAASESTDNKQPGEGTNHGNRE